MGTRLVRRRAMGEEGSASAELLCAAGIGLAAWSWLRETFSRMSEICEWTACRDCWSLRAMSEGRSLLTRYRQIVACFSVRSMVG